MPPEPETEVISCPACNHLLRVPAELLGQPVQCPECRAMFRAPARDGRGGLTPAELISRPAVGPAAARTPMDPMLLLPAFGLLLCGVVGTVVNASLVYLFLTDAPAARQYLKNQFAEARKYGFGADEPEAERDRLDDARAVETARTLRWILPATAAAAGLAFLGGLAMAARRGYRLAQAGCVAAMLNVTGFCCVPGAVAGLWGLLMLGSLEGRAHFGK